MSSRYVIASCFLASCLAITGCGDGGPNGSFEEDCCACVQDQGCGGSSYDFAVCVADGVRGATAVSYDLACVASNCSVCDGNSFTTQAVAPRLACAPASTTVGEPLCACMAGIVCDQIAFCLDATELATRPAAWSTRTACVTALASDCTEDVAAGTDYVPANFAQCVADLGARSCADYGDFAAMARFPQSCQNLRALDTALGVTQ